jgi:hypothetical protein
VSDESRTELSFGSIEGAARYLGDLLAAVNEAHEDLKAEALLAASAGAERREQAIQLASYKLSQLNSHLTTSHRLLNDLRTIRRLLFAERVLAAPAGGTGKAAGQFVTTAESAPVETLRSATGRPKSPRLDR